MTKKTAPNDNPTLQLKRYFTNGTHPFQTIQWERRDALIEGSGDKPVFEQRDVSFPADWSQNATNIVAQKYFAGQLGSEAREWSVKQLIGRVVEKIGAEGMKHGYFQSQEEQEIFEHELAHILVHQMAAFNSPVWFNIGVEGVSQQCSACFILHVDDHLQDITRWYSEEALIFQNGSGSGVNLSNLRASSEPLTRGGHSSGPVTFMRAADSSAGTITSGGRCLAPSQKVYTASGPTSVQELAESGEDFVVFSYDPPAGRYKAKTARAWKQDFKKNLVEVRTDKGVFALSEDHPVRLSTGEYVKAGELKPGASLFAGTISYSSDDYLRIGLKDGQKTKERLHRLVAKDVLGQDIEGMSVHHIDGNRFNNDPRNLEVMTQSEHAALHGKETAATGEHVFQLNNFAKNGSENPMHRDSSFWQDKDRVASYKAKQSQLLHQRGDASEMQEASAQQKMLNTAYQIINSGYSIDTFEDYVSGRKKAIGRIPSISKLKTTIEERFGSYSNFVKEVDANNHRVSEVVAIGESEVYDVEVDCPTADDKSPQSGHNFLIWDGEELTGSGVVVSNTRRAAKMVILDIDHPDVEDFIWCKAHEEKKARALAQAGFDMALNTPEGEKNWASIQYQNANNSVRLTDAFLKAVEKDQDWQLVARASGEPVRTVKARDLLKQIADAAWECADPGVQYDTTINSWHTCPNHSRINASNPCSEYMHVDDSSCNLASLNLMKFRQEDGTFNVDAFRHAVQILFLAQEILIAFADYPTEKIGENTRAMRQIGMGYANLGAYLMANGLPYDSEEGRNVAGAITALMHCEAYAQSARIAERMGPYQEYANNQDAQLRVIKRHRTAANKLEAWEGDLNLTRAAKRTAREMVDLSEAHGVRNAQASVAAPTGTISFLMDCDTTGIEPDFSLVKFKKLVGGGSMTIVNQTVPQALSRLGYDPHQSAEIVEYIREHNSVVGAPHLNEEDYPVFDTAVGERAISYMGHLKMMAAAQPFLSGAISKTVNLPADITKEDIFDVYLEAWRMGLKAVAIYRDGTKTAQPLGDNEGDEENVITSLLGDGLLRGQRRRVPDDGEAVKRRFEITSAQSGNVSGHIVVGLFEDGTPGELFVNVSQAGSTLRGFIDTWARLFSMALQYGAPLEDLVAKQVFTQFEPAGFTNDKEIARAKSIPDYVVRWMAARFLDPDYHAMLGINTPEAVDASPEVDISDAQKVQPRIKVKPSTHAPTTPQKPDITLAGTGTCSKCGGLMVQTGKCMTCTDCGETGGCG